MTTCFPAFNAFTRDKDYLGKRTGIELDLRYIVDRDFSRAKALGLDDALYETNFDRVLADPKIVLVPRIRNTLMRNISEMYREMEDTAEEKKESSVPVF